MYFGNRIAAETLVRSGYGTVRNLDQHRLVTLELDCAGRIGGIRARRRGVERDRCGQEVTAAGNRYLRAVRELGEAEKLRDVAGDADRVADGHRRCAAREHENAVGRVDVAVRPSGRRLHEKPVRRQGRDGVVERDHFLADEWRRRARALDLVYLERAEDRFFAAVEQ